MPVLVDGSADWATVTVGSESACAIRTNGSVSCWGANGYGQRGVNTTVSKATPTPVLTSLTFAQVTLYDSATCGVPGVPLAAPAITALPPTPPVAATPLNCWGSGVQFTFGDGSTSGTRKVPLTFTDPDWASVSMNSNNACGIYSPTGSGVGVLRCWGVPTTGVMGDGTTSAHAWPKEVSGGGQWQSVMAAYQYACGIQVGGSLFCWGLNA